MEMHAVAGIIYNSRGKILIGRKKQNSPKFLAGEWHIPGETTENNETDEEALIRGMKEETNLEIKVGIYLASSIGPTSKKEVKWYECFAITSNLIPGSDLEEAKFVEREEILKICNERVYSLWPEKIINYFS